MVRGALQPDMTWAEDRAPVRTDPSADPGAKTEGGRCCLSTPPYLPSPFGIGTQALNLRGTMPRPFRQDALQHSLTPTPPIPVSAEPGQFDSVDELGSLNHVR